MEYLQLVDVLWDWMAVAIWPGRVIYIRCIVTMPFAGLHRSATQVFPFFLPPIYKHVHRSAASPKCCHSELAMEK